MKQITVVARNRPGLLADVTGTLAAAGIDIENADAQAFADSAVILLTVDRYDDALRALRSVPEINAVSEDAILVRLQNEPGALARLSRRFKDAGIDLRSIRFLQRDDDFALVAISTGRNAEALDLVKDLLVG
ncbi:MAG: ACT domain-containing protein [Gammaproteobacteria bacterium]|nr:ACT domain-containing protein [Gammaproteobacteria bacterium]